jgi:hypothetical protein
MDAVPEAEVPAERQGAETVDFMFDPSSNVQVHPRIPKLDGDVTQ